MGLQIGDVELASRFFLGTAGYPSPQVLQDAIAASGAQVVTVGLKRQLAGDGKPNDLMRLIRESGARLPDVPLIGDAGIGSPRDAVEAMELGFDGVLLNSAVAHAQDPVAMARAFRLAVEAGRLAWQAGIMARQDMAVPSTPVTGRPFIL